MKLDPLIHKIDDKANNAYDELMPKLTYEVHDRLWTTLCFFWIEPLIDDLL
jgi:hypothetical protein